MEYCNSCGLYYKKVFKLAPNKSVKHQEKLGNIIVTHVIYI